jgi:hypothetical protein
VGRTLLKSADSIIIALIPLLYIAINPSFGQNQPGDIDTWFYFGLAKAFWHQFGPGNHYYGTRLPFIIPAALVFSLPSDRIASLVFSYLLYCVSAFSLLYVLRRHVSKPAAFLATVLLVSDIFFMRTVGWQYVDGGVLAYGSLTFVALTAAAAASNRSTYRCFALVVLSGFFLTSMVIVHVGSAPLTLAAIGYAFLVFDVTHIRRWELSRLFVSAILGGLICQLIYGVLNMRLYGANFLFEREQITAGTMVQSNPEYFGTPLHLLFTVGWWLAIHLAVWLAAGVMIVAWLARAYSPTGLQLYCMSTVFVCYLTLFLFDYFKLAIFLGRVGLYASFYLFLSYLFVGSIIPNSIKRLSAAIVGGLFLCSLVLRWHFEALLADYLAPIPVWAVGVVLGAVIAAAALMKQRIVQGLLVPVAIAMVLPITIKGLVWYENTIYAARDVVARMAGGTLPYFVVSDTDPIYEPVLIGLIGSFTPRAWWLKCKSFPDCSPRHTGPRMIIVSSNPDPAQVAQMASSMAPAAILSGTTKINRPGGDFSIYNFTIPPPARVILAPELHSAIGVVEGDARVAEEGTAAGYLTDGPYAVLDPGGYEITLKYKAEGETGSWDIVSNSSVFPKGSIPDTRGTTSDLVTTIDLPKGAKDFAVRTFYSGHGRLAVESLSIKPLSVLPTTH